MSSKEVVNEVANKENIEITQKELRSVFWRSFSMEFSWNYERQMNIAYTYAIIPVLKKLFPKKEDMAEALKRHMEFFNTTPHVVTLILGITAAMEEDKAKDKDFDPSTINSIKTSLMGPLAGIGDSFFWGTLRLLATGIGASLSMQGNVLGPILFLLIFNIPHILIRYLLTNWGYVLGTGFLKRVQESGALESLRFGAVIIGLMVIGAMSATLIEIDIPLKVGSGDAAQSITQIANEIVPNLLALGVFGVVFWMLKRHVKPLAILGILALVGITGSFFGLL